MRRIKRNRYKSIYTAHRRHNIGALKVIIGLILAAAVIFVGYSIADPLGKLISGKWKPTASSSTVVSSSKPAVSSSKPAAKKPETKVSSTTVRGVYLPKSYLSNTALLNSFIAQAKSAGINLAIIDLKAEDGVVNYASKVEDAKEMVSAGAPDASVAAKALSDAGITPAARICAFEDPVAPTVLRGAGVMYVKNHSINWLDPMGKRWLNPNSQKAQDYISSLAAEAVSLGYKQVFIDSLTFPTRGNPDSTGYYGDMTSKEQVISSFVSTLRQKVNAAGGKLSVVVTGAAAVGQAPSNLGQSQDMFELSGDYICPNFCPSLLTTGSIQVGASTIANPDLTPGDTVYALAQYIKSTKSAKLGTTIPFIQAYTNKSLGYGKYKQYTTDDIKAEITSLSKAGISNYILYNPDGTYDLNSIK